jgi:serine/threonine protein kinase
MYDHGAPPLAAVESSYASILLDHGVSFRETGHFLQVGELLREQGWLLHISVVPTQLWALMESILPELLAYRVPFKIVKNQVLHAAYNNAGYGQFKIGKIITVFLEDETIISALTASLVTRTCDFTGPKVATDFRVGNVVYARYGAFFSHVQPDGYGNLDRVIMDRQGRWIKDTYRVPPVLPAGISNPFVPFMAQIPRSFENPLKGKYKLKAPLRAGIWGAVYEARYKDGEGNPDRCLIKRGKRGTLADSSGDDMMSRMNWQHQVTMDLQEHLPMPKVIDFWTEKDQAFMVMQWADERNLAKFSRQLLEGSTWLGLTADKKQQIIHYALEVIVILQKIHRLGYVHRNVHPAQFYIDPAGRLNLFELDLSYAIIDRDLSVPFFKGGTRGFISPSQVTGQTPSFEDDIYAFGALLLYLMTGLSPYRLVEENRENLRVKLCFFTGDDDFTELLLNCLTEYPGQRPGWDSIWTTLLEYQSVIVRDHPRRLHGFRYTRPEMNVVVKQALCGFDHPLMLSEGGWISHVENEYGSDVYPLWDKHTFTGLYRGVGGVLYLLCKAKELDLDISYLYDPMEEAWDFIGLNALDKLDEVNPGLHYGASGLAVLLGRSMQSGLLPQDASYLEIIRQCLGKPNEQSDLINGLAGDGLALLQCQAYLDPKVFQDLLAPVIYHLTRSQDEEGAWKEMGRDNTSGEVKTGFGFGVAGIVYFLLEYGYRFGAQDAIDAADRGLVYLDQHMVTNGVVNRWPISNLDSTFNDWWAKGGPGIALAYLKSYEHTGNRSHLSVAEKAMRVQPVDRVYGSLSQYHGMAGLGEIYLEAFRVTGQEEWWDRAGWIAQYLCAVKFQPDQERVYWLAENSHFPTADLMVGGSGVIHFLLRYLHPDKVFFPLLPEPVKQ